MTAFTINKPRPNSYEDSLNDLLGPYHDIIPSHSEENSYEEGYFYAEEEEEENEEEHDDDMAKTNTMKKNKSVEDLVQEIQPYTSFYYKRSKSSTNLAES